MGMTLEELKAAAAKRDQAQAELERILKGEDE